MNVFIANPMKLAERDNCIHQMETQLDSKKNAMFKKHTQLEDLSKQNKFLHGVKEDYINYYDYMINEKIEQINALKKIQMYISNVNSSLTSTHNTVSGFKNDEELIKNEISKIKATIDKLMKVTPDKYKDEIFKMNNVNVVNPKLTENVNVNNPRLTNNVNVGNKIPANNAIIDKEPPYNAIMDKEPPYNAIMDREPAYNAIMDKKIVDNVNVVTPKPAYYAIMNK